MKLCDKCERQSEPLSGEKQSNLRALIVKAALAGKWKCPFGNKKCGK